METTEGTAPKQTRLRAKQAAKALNGASLSLLIRFVISRSRVQVTFPAPSLFDGIRCGPKCRSDFDPHRDPHTETIGRGGEDIRPLRPFQLDLTLLSSFNFVLQDDIQLRRVRGGNTRVSMPENVMDAAVIRNTTLVIGLGSPAT